MTEEQLEKLAKEKIMTEFVIPTAHVHGQIKGFILGYQTALEKPENEILKTAINDLSLSMIKGTTLNNHYYDVQYDENGKTLWVHCSSGETVGRFDSIFGIDIHNTIEDQIENDKPQCLHCTHTKPTKEDFDFFCDYAKNNWNIEIDKSKIKI